MIKLNIYFYEVEAYCKDDLRDLSYLIAISPDMRLLWFHVMVIAINY